jgi:hypothetical protein
LKVSVPETVKPAVVDCTPGFSYVILNVSTASAGAAAIRARPRIARVGSERVVMKISQAKWTIGLVVTLQ